MTVSQQPVSIISDWPLEDEAVWKRIFAESAIGTPRHSRSLNGLAYFLEHGGTQAIWVPIYAALQVKIKP